MLSAQSTSNPSSSEALAVDLHDITLNFELSWLGIVARYGDIISSLEDQSLLFRSIVSGIQHHLIFPGVKEAMRYFVEDIQVSLKFATHGTARNKALVLEILENDFNLYSERGKIFFGEIAEHQPPTIGKRFIPDPITLQDFVACFNGDKEAVRKTNMWFYIVGFLDREMFAKKKSRQKNGTKVESANQDKKYFLRGLEILSKYNTGLNFFGGQDAADYFAEQPTVSELPAAAEQDDAKPVPVNESKTSSRKSLVTVPMRLFTQPSSSVRLFPIQPDEKRNASKHSGTLVFDLDGTLINVFVDRDKVQWVNGHRYPSTLNYQQIKAQYGDILPALISQDLLLGTKLAQCDTVYYFLFPGVREVMSYFVKDIHACLKFASYGKKSRNDEIIANILEDTFGSNYEQATEPVQVYSRNELVSHKYKPPTVGNKFIFDDPAERAAFEGALKKDLSLMTPGVNVLHFEDDIDTIQEDQFANAFIMPNTTSQDFADCLSGNEEAMHKTNMWFCIVGFLDREIFSKKDIPWEDSLLKFKLKDGLSFAIKNLTNNEIFQNRAYFVRGLQILRHHNPELNFWGGRDAAHYFGVEHRDVTQTDLVPRRPKITSPPPPETDLGAENSSRCGCFPWRK